METSSWFFLPWSSFGCVGGWYGIPTPLCARGICCHVEGVAKVQNNTVFSRWLRSRCRGSASARLKVCHWVKVSQARSRGGGAGDGTAHRRTFSSGSSCTAREFHCDAEDQTESEWNIQRSDETRFESAWHPENISDVFSCDIYRHLSHEWNLLIWIPQNKVRDVFLMSQWLLFCNVILILETQSR